jgi:hypothetical protein
MQGYVLSYLYGNNYPNDLPRSYRQHHVPDVYNNEVIDAQVRNERGNVPANFRLAWTR